MKLDQRNLTSKIKIQVLNKIRGDYLFFNYPNARNTGKKQTNLAIPK